MTAVAVVKYMKQAVPDCVAWPTLAEAEAYCAAKERYNPYVRWTSTRPDDSAGHKARFPNDCDRELVRHAELTRIASKSPGDEVL